ncbi:Anti-sigma-B factor antagonist (Anti-anti-sigma-B factor) [Durusdinium trenchii]|uniref:Anti-sigma-B factor antagonist (Anti-anti-sigma-B factor) n=1 Tax=Durusdinium trenchii TaxID=1381693 RepID=A0ABP0NTB3_9DINO
MANRFLITFRNTPWRGAAWADAGPAGLPMRGEAEFSGPRRKPLDGTLAIWAFVIVALSAMVVTAVAEDRTSQARVNRLSRSTGEHHSGPSNAPLSSEGPLIREGEIWHNELGHIFLSGSRYAFRPVQGGRSVIVLENLNLQRIVQRLDETPDAPIWSISGVITEFQGSGGRRNTAAITQSGRKLPKGARVMGVNRRLEVSEVGDVTVVQFVDRKILDEANIQDLGQELFQLVEGDNRKKLLLNFTSVDFLSSAALGKLITLDKKVKAHSGILKLCNIRPEIYEVFAITKLNKLFDIKDDEADALADF